MRQRIMRKSEVLDVIGLSYSHLKRLVKSGEFPAPVKLGVRAVGWLSEEVDEWLTSRPRSDMSVW